MIGPEKVTKRPAQHKKGQIGPEINSWYIYLGTKRTTVTWDSCERSEPHRRVGWCISLVYIYIIYLYQWAVHLVPRGPPVNAQRANVRPAE